MKQAFETIVDSYLENNVGIATEFLSKDLRSQLTNNLRLLVQNKQLQSAGIGSKSNLVYDTQIRSDSIYWLDRQHNNKYENQFLDTIDDFVQFLNTTCYAGITSYEFHYAAYDIGSSFKRHLDQFRNNNQRAFSMIIYLNENWQKPDGGELCIYQENQIQLIAPQDGTCVFFKSSQLEHEVLLCNKYRMSITGWLKTS